MNLFAHMSSRLLLVFVMLAVAAASGCDAVQNEPIVLYEEFETDYTFTADGEGNLVSGSSAATINLQPFLEQQGFATDEVLAASVQPGSVELVLRSPLQQNLTILDQAILQFEHEDMNLEVANVQSFPEDRDVPMNVLADRDISQFVRAPVFQAILQLDMGSPEPGEEYQFTVLGEIRIELEGI